MGKASMIEYFKGCLEELEKFRKDEKVDIEEFDKFKDELLGNLDHIRSERFANLIYFEKEDDEEEDVPF